MSTTDFIEAIRADIMQNLRQEIMAELQPEIQRQLRANIFDVSEACDYLKISKSTIRRMVKDNEIPHFYQRGNVYFRQIALDGWTAELEERNRK